MTKEEIIEMAREAGGIDVTNTRINNITVWLGTGTFEFLEAFAKLIAKKTIKEALAQPERDYERGFIDGMQKQMQSSVDKAVNAMTQRTWVGCAECGVNGNHALYCVKCAEKYLKEKNIR